MKKMIRKMTIFTLIMALVLSVGVVPASAAAKKAKIKEIEYKGKGVVEAEFYGKVRFSKPSVTIKDNKGKKYRAKVVKRDRDDIKFRIVGYKAGRTYTFGIKRVKPWRGGKYATVYGKVAIKAVPKFIGVAKAKQIALNNARLNANQVRFIKAKLDYDDGRYIYDVEFRKGYLEYDYEILATNGRIVSKDVDYDD